MIIKLGFHCNLILWHTCIYYSGVISHLCCQVQSQSAFVECHPHHSYLTIILFNTAASILWIMLIIFVFLFYFQSSIIEKQKSKRECKIYPLWGIFRLFKADFQNLIYRPSLTKLHDNGKFINQGNYNVHPLIAPPPFCLSISKIVTHNFWPQIYS